VNDIKLSISLGNGRNDTNWKNKTVTWEALAEKLSKSEQTRETHAQFMEMTKDQRASVKDIGGFVGGRVKNGRRLRKNVPARQVVTLDADFAPEDFVGEIQDSFALDCAMVVYSTHTHAPGNPRYRLIIPLTREVDPDEYGAVSRKIAEKLNMDWFDDTTYEVHRLMYWPSHSKDVEPFYWRQDGEILDPDSILSEYKDWTDQAEWPVSSRVTEKMRKPAEKVEDPLEKKGTVGAFCRTYTITQAIEKFLPDVYTPTIHEDRWTYAAGSTSGGLVIYDNDRLAYSHHSTDPVSGLDVNAFDLVRLHKFGALDEDAQGKNIKQLPSYKAMIDFAASDPETAVTIAEETVAKAKTDFEAPAEEEEPAGRDHTKWMLQFHKCSAKGVPIDIIDLTIVDYIKSTQKIILLAGEPYIYQDGVYTLDDAGARLKGLIKDCIFRDLVTISRIDRVYKLLLADAGLRHDIDGLNQHPTSWINCRNGMLDLMTLQLHPHDPKYYSINQVPFAWDPDYKAPEGSIMEEYLQAAIPKEDNRQMFMEYAGYCLSPYIGFQKYLIVTGNGGIGKSVLLGLIEGIVGPRNASALSLQSLAQRFYSRFLYGKLLNSCGDLSSEAMTDTGTLKLVTGEDPVQAEIKGGEVFHFHPYVKLLFSANRIPVTRDEQSDAFYRRLMILPLRQAEKYFPNLKERLRSDLATFFHLAVLAGSEAFRRGRLTESADSVYEVQDLHDRTDTVSAFLRKCAEKDPQVRTKTKDAYKVYEDYCLENDRNALSRTSFRANMKEKGFTIVAVHGVDYFKYLMVSGAEKVEEVDDF